MSLEIGVEAPLFVLPTEQNTALALKDLRGKKVVLYFYPKDNTPGCTLEACSFNKAISQFAALNTEVLGISKDSVLSHEKFKKRYHLAFPLLADTEAQVAHLYGVMMPKQMFGKSYLGIERSTFLINEYGIILKIWRKVKVFSHIEQILETIKHL